MRLFLDKHTLLIVLILLSVFITGCASQPITNSYGPGFFHGFYHGFISPFTLIGSFFTDIRIYSVPNTGPFYDLGFIMGIITIIGSGPAAARQYDS